MKDTDKSKRNWDQKFARQIDNAVRAICSRVSFTQISSFLGGAVEKSHISGLCRKFSQLVFRSDRFGERALLGVNSSDQ